MHTLSSSQRLLVDTTFVRVDTHFILPTLSYVELLAHFMLPTLTYVLVHFILPPLTYVLERFSPLLSSSQQCVRLYYDSLYTRRPPCPRTGGGRAPRADGQQTVQAGRGLHSFPFQLNLSSSVHRITQINS